MGTITKFTDLAAWQEAHKLTITIYKYTKNFPRDELFGITSQLRRAAISIESCIAEGFSRYHFKDKLNFYYDSRGSLSEVQGQSITAKDLEYLDKPSFQEVWTQSEKTTIILSGLIKSTKNQIVKKKSS